METIELLEHMVRMQGELHAQAKTIETMTKTLNLACRRIVDLEHCMERAEGIVRQNVNDIEEILGNNTLPKNKTKAHKKFHLTLIARQAAKGLADE